MVKVKSLPNPMNHADKRVYMNKVLTFTLREKPEANNNLEATGKTQLYGCCMSDNGVVKITLKMDSNTYNADDKFKVHYVIDADHCKKELEHITFVVL